MNPKVYNQLLSIQTIIGKSQTRFKFVYIEIRQDVQLKAIIVDTKIQLDKPEIDIPSLWPTLEPNVRKETEITFYL